MFADSRVLARYADGAITLTGSGMIVVAFVILAILYAGMRR